MDRRCVLPGYETSTPQAQQKALQEAFQRLFKTEDGRVVLNALLSDLYYFNGAKTEAEKALCEYAKFFLKERLGITKTLTVTDALLESIA